MISAPRSSPPRHRQTMAQSLADELAAFDEQAMGGGGMSLADEFGLEMEIDPDAPSGLGTGE